MSVQIAGVALSSLRPLIVEHIDWSGWERLIEAQGVTIDRPARTQHPEYPQIIYPIDYGYVNGTIGSDGEALDCFVGTGDTGVAAALLTRDYRRGDREVKLLLDCTPPEIYTAHGFINYDRSLLEGVLAMQRPMHTLWARDES